MITFPVPQTTSPRPLDADPDLSVSRGKIYRTVSFLLLILLREFPLLQPPRHHLPALTFDAGMLSFPLLPDPGNCQLAAPVAAASRGRHFFTTEKESRHDWRNDTGRQSSPHFPDMITQCRRHAPVKHFFETFFHPKIIQEANVISSG